jgi:UDP-N-acetylmuramoyl-tripeptide--D-alanyl-D-alanine ligase
MIAAILRTAYHDTADNAVILAPQGNFNNDIGLPLTLLKLAAKHRAAVVELGMNHPGEIAALTRLAAPTVALVTNAQRAHLEGMGDLEAVAREKGSIYAGLQADGVALVNDEDAYAGLWRAQNAGRRVIGFGLTAASDIFGVAQLHGLETRLTLHTPQGQADIALSAPGRHNVMNALAAAAAAFALGLPLQTIAAGLENFRGVKGRLQRLSGSNGADILDDTYNANPDSVRAGIAVLAATVGRKILVLGDMGEIGAGSLQYHDEIGGYAKSMGIDALYALGDASQQAARNFGAGGSSFSTPEDLLKALQGEALHPGDTLLIKGSRFMKMERIVQALVSPSQEGEP